MHAHRQRGRAGRVWHADTRPPTSVIRTQTSSTVTREQARLQALQAAKASAPEVRILEARLEQVDAELIEPAEAQKRGASGMKVAQLWWVTVRGYFRYQGMPVPGA